MPTSSPPDGDLPTTAAATVRQRSQGPRHQQLLERMRELDPGFPELADTYIFGAVWSRPGMNFHDRMLVAIVSLATQGHVDQLKNYLHGAVHDGMSARRIQEALMMVGVYAGVPHMANALATWHTVKESAIRQGLRLDLDEPPEGTVRSDAAPSA